MATIFIDDQSMLFVRQGNFSLKKGIPHAHNNTITSCGGECVLSANVTQGMSYVSVLGGTLNPNSQNVASVIDVQNASNTQSAPFSNTVGKGRPSVPKVPTFTIDPTVTWKFELRSSGGGVVFDGLQGTANASITSAAPSKNSNHIARSNTPAVIGILIAGGVVTAILIFLAIFLFNRRRQRQRRRIDTANARGSTAGPTFSSVVSWTWRVTRGPSIFSRRTAPAAAAAPPPRLPDPYFFTTASVSSSDRSQSRSSTRAPNVPRPDQVPDVPDVPESLLPAHMYIPPVGRSADAERKPAVPPPAAWKGKGKAVEEPSPRQARHPPKKPLRLVGTPAASSASSISS